MMTVFSAIDALASAALDTVLGERLRFTPRGKATNYGRAIDPDRPTVECVGTFLEGGIDVGFTDGDRPQSSFSGRVAGQRANVSVERRYFPAGKEPRTDDMVETLDQSPPRRFAVVEANANGETRLVLTLVPA